MSSTYSTAVTTPTSSVKSINNTTGGIMYKKEPLPPTKHSFVPPPDSYFDFPRGVMGIGGQVSIGNRNSLPATDSKWRSGSRR